MKVTESVEISAEKEAYKKLIIAGDDGTRVVLSSYGATLSDWSVPDRTGEISSVVLGYSDIDSMRKDTSYLGCIVGRVANRIGAASYPRNDIKHKLSANDGNNQLHGGKIGFNKKNWDALTGDNFVEFTCRSEAGEEGFPVKLRREYDIVSKKQTPEGFG